MNSSRITVVAGHYGSGKTEFAVNLALMLSKIKKKIALIDLDIANPYFRSRERQGYLEERGIDVYSNAYKFDITQDLPAIDSAIRMPLADPDCHVVLDVGGDDNGARVLNQFKRFLNPEETETLCVINSNRRETDKPEGALKHLLQIEKETGIRVGGIVSNTHMLRETTAEDIARGARVCKEVLEKLKAMGRNVPVKYLCCVRDLVDDFTKEYPKLALEQDLFPMKLYMRPKWLDFPVDSGGTAIKQYYPEKNKR
ncbi:MAG: ATP-binding protein [Anaerovoracaceae bacterium]